MINHLARLARHSAVYGLAETVSRGTGFVLMFMYLRMLSDAEIGIRTLLYTGSAFVILFYSMGLDQAFLRYFMDESLKDRRKEIFTSSVAFTVTIGLVFLFLSLTNGPFISNQFTESESWVYATVLLFVIMILDTLSLYPMQVLRAENRFGYYLFISAERFMLFIVLNLLFVGAWRRGVNGVFEANLAVVSLVVVSLLPVYRKYLGWRISPVLLKRMLAFGIPTVFTVLSMRVIDLSGRRIVQHFMSESDVGRYAAVGTLGMVGIMVFVNSFRIAWQPFFLSLQDKREAKDVFAQVATFYSLFIGFVFLGMTLFRREIWTLFATSDYPVWLADIIPVVALGYILYGFYIVLLPAAFIREKTSILTAASIAGAVVNLALNFALIPPYGIMGAAVATVGAYLVMVGALFFLSRRIYQVSYDLRRILVIWPVIAVPVAISLLVSPTGLAARLLLNTALLALPLPILWLIRFWKADEIQAFRTLMKRIR